MGRVPRRVKRAARTNGHLGKSPKTWARWPLIRRWWLRANRVVAAKVEAEQARDWEDRTLPEP
jgi:hypothetical protein